jgi:hypothetical protein
MKFRHVIPYLGLRIRLFFAFAHRSSVACWTHRTAGLTRVRVTRRPAGQMSSHPLTGRGTQRGDQSRCPIAACREHLLMAEQRLL